MLAEEAWRRECRKSLLSFCIEALEPFGQTPADHHRLLIRELELVARGECDRLAVFMPPGSAKTTYASVLFPAWAMEALAPLDVIGTSYNAEYAEDISGRVMREAELGAEAGILRYHLTSNGRKLWRTDNRGQYRAAGAGGGITGRRADLIIIDDPIKGREDADSPTIREKVFKWYRAEVITRLKPGARIILIQTRWHQDDLAGRLLDEMKAGADQWRVIDLPAIAGDNDPLGRPKGTALWPEWEDEDALARKRRAVGEREWSALYQQQPAPPEGAVFKVSQIGIVPTAPAGGTVVRAWDLAATEETGTNDPDWTVGLKLMRDPVGRYIVLDVIRDRFSPHELDNAIQNTAAADGRSVAIGLPQDPGQAGKYQAQYYARMLAGYTLKISPETGSKLTRATPAASQAEVGNVSLVQAAWNRSFLEELALFPAGRHDDQVDAFSRAFGMLTEARPPLRVSDSLLHRAMQRAR